ncbi:unnamed protein product [Rotaria sordida]|uniref:USP domain-containing protein n=1 Tax=Rotaria sordida TaxID=392033 RepID=A0A818ZE57_9BILA|nr:unnamed protein product [Rotaria sordida]CAF3765993.1 unnamed protein product [Rotaria sordida]
MTVDTAAVPDNKKNNLSITKRDRRDVIRQVREITGLDENSINQTIEACKDGTGRYSLEQVISLLFDDSNLRNNLQRTAQPSNNPSQQTSNVPTNNPIAAGPTYDRNNDTITDDVIEISPEIDNQQPTDDELERALLLSRETMEQIIDESDIAERKSLDEPAGLKNVGNTCWFNSVVQALYTLPYFRQLILNFQYPTINRSLTDSEQQAICFTEELRYLFALMLKSPRRSINPDRAIKKFKNTRKLCGVDFSHEDCSEFAMHLIDLIELAYETIGKNLLNIDNTTPMSFINPVNTLVTGEVVVERNEHISIREALRQINIQMIDSSNIYDGLETLLLGSADESLCNQQAIVEQRWLTRLPSVLFICLNRYHFSHTTKQASKIIAPFEFYPELYLDRYMLINKNVTSNKRNIAKTLYAQLHDLENTLNSYLKYPCNDESFALANAIRVVYEFATGCRLNPTLPKRTESTSPDQTTPNRVRQHTQVPIQPSHISPEELQFIQNALPIWLTEVEAKCANIREEIQRLKNELKQLYDEPQLKQVRYTLHAVCVHEGSATLGHFWTYVYHNDRQKWYRYNDNEVLVCETTWTDVFDAGIGGQRAQNNREEPRVPSAYLLVYINAEQESLSNDIQYELPVDLQRVLDDDLVLLQQQIESIKLEQLHSDLKSICERIEKQQPVHRALMIPFFAGPNAPSDSEIVKPVLDSTLRVLKTYAPKILSIEVDRLLQEIVEKEIKTYLHTANIITSALPHNDYRLQHVLSYLSANRVESIYRQRVMYDIIRLATFPNDDIRLRIFKLQAQIICNDMQMSNDEVQEYQKLLTDYKDFRSVIAAFLAGCQLMNEDKFEDAITYFCVACEYNLRLSKQCTLPMRAMDSCLLFKARRLCFERWNDVVINRFKTDPEYRLDTMTHQFLPCLMQLKLSSEEDQAYITEIQRIWCLLLDKLEPTERSLSLEEFLQRLLEQPIGQHYHSVSINKHQLVERYEEAVRDLIHRYPSFSGSTTDQQQQQSPNRSNRTPVLTAPVPIPVVIPQQQQQQQENRLPENMPVIDPRGSSPMQQGDEEQESSLPPSSS